MRRNYCILWDWDGVLVDSAGNQFEWFQYWASHPNNKGSKTLEVESLEDFLPIYNEKTALEGGVQNAYEHFGLDCSISDHSHPVWSAFYEFKERNPPEIFPEIKEIIPEIFKLGNLGPNNNIRMRMGINSSNSWRNIGPTLENEGLIQYFDSYVTAETINTLDGSGRSDAFHKPSKVSTAYSLGMLGSQGSSTIFFGDTLNDLQAAKEVLHPMRHELQDLIVVGVTWGFENEEVLRRGVGNYNFNHILTNFEEIIPLIKEYR